MVRGLLVVLIVVASGLVGVAQDDKLRFDLASVRALTASASPASFSQFHPSGIFRSGATTVTGLIMLAYDVLQDHQVEGGPDWARSDLFQIDARAGRNASQTELRAMLQALLEDRFRLRVHRESREMEHLRLVRARVDGSTGPYMVRVAEGVEGACDPGIVDEAIARFPPRSTTAAPSGMWGRCATLKIFILQLAVPMRTPIVDATGLTGRWAYDLRYAGGMAPPYVQSLDSTFPPFDTALEQQPGLKLERANGPLDVLVIDSVERPSPN